MWYAVLNEMGDPENGRFREEEMYLHYGEATAFAWRHKDSGGTWVRAFSNHEWLEGDKGVKRFRTPEAAAEYAASLLGLPEAVELPDYQKTLVRDRKEHLAAKKLREDAARAEYKKLLLVT